MSHAVMEPPQCLEQRREQPTHREDCHQNEEAVQQQVSMAGESSPRSGGVVEGAPTTATWEEKNERERGRERREQQDGRVRSHTCLEPGAPTEGRTSERRAGAGKGEGQTMEKSIKCPAVWLDYYPAGPGKQ